jgi:hypothetical protein
MKPLTLDDLIPLEEYAARRREFFASHRKYLDRYRRVRIGPRLTLVFENRQTLWFRVQEVLRIARLTDSERLKQELALYNHLLPGRDQLQAALLIEVADEARLKSELADWQDLSGEQLTLHLGEHRLQSLLLTSRPEDRCVGTAHWVQFCIDPTTRGLLADATLPTYFVFDNGTYSHRSAPLNDDLRQSLLDDLQLSDRDEAA